MLDSLTCFVLQILHKVEKHMILKMIFSNLSNPRGYCCWEENKLRRFSLVFLFRIFDCFHDLLNILLETLIEHLICLVEHNRSQFLEVNVLSLNMVKDSSSGSYKELDAVFKLPLLVLNRYASVDCDDIELLLIVSQLFKLVGDLECQLSCWS